MGKFYLTTAIPYVNAKPHVGHALEYIFADTVHRYHELIGDEVFLASGADENALKNVQAAEKEGLPIQAFLDKYSKVFRDFYKLLDVNLNEFRRGTDQTKHWPGVQKLWELCTQNGDIYIKKYKGLYCTGCESFKTQKELIDGKCPNHNRKPELIEEENYFFKLSRYQKQLTDLIESNTLKIYPQKRKNEILSFIKEGLEDFSISRSNERARGVGVPVPNDPTQKMYVWFDALNIYMTAVGYGYDDKLWQKWWPADLHVIGKDIIRFHAIYWPAMLLAAKLPLPESLLVHGFITSGGKKMSKSVGNVVDPYEVIEKYSVEALRYYFLARIPTQDDGDFTIENFEEVYNADLANGLGNLTSRVAAMAAKENLEIGRPEKLKFSREVSEGIEGYQFNLALEYINNEIKRLNTQISEKRVWELENVSKKQELESLIKGILQIAFYLKPFLPQTSEKIEKIFTDKIKSTEPLFPRLNK